jgi:hypothetical protein
VSTPSGHVRRGSSDGLSVPAGPPRGAGPPAGAGPAPPPPAPPMPQSTPVRGSDVYHRPGFNAAIPVAAPSPFAAPLPEGTVLSRVATLRRGGVAGIGSFSSGGNTPRESGESGSHLAGGPVLAAGLSMQARVAQFEPASAQPSPTPSACGSPRVVAAGSGSLGGGGGGGGGGAAPADERLRAAMAELSVMNKLAEERLAENVRLRRRLKGSRGGRASQGGEPAAGGGGGGPGEEGGHEDDASSVCSISSQVRARGVPVWPLPSIVPT